MHLLQQMKLAFGDARVELIKVGKNLPRLLQNLDKWEHEEEQTLAEGAHWSSCIEIERAVSESRRC